MLKGFHSFPRHTVVFITKHTHKHLSIESLLSVT